MNSFPGKYFLWSWLFCLGTGVAYGQQDHQNLTAQFYSGFGTEDFSWSVAGNGAGQDPNILSELKWENISGPVVGLAMSWNLWKKFSMSGGYRSMLIRSGSVSDQDYQGDNRTHQTYAGRFSDTRGFSDQARWLIGYDFKDVGLFTLRPYAGYTLKRQLLYLLDPAGTSEGLHSSYQTNWQGPLLRLDALFHPKKRVAVLAAMEYCQVRYRGKADWNLIETFSHPVSFRHTAKGYGLTLQAGLEVFITRVLQVDLGYARSVWQTGKGVDELFQISGEVDRTQLNPVSNRGHFFSGGLGISF